MHSRPSLSTVRKRAVRGWSNNSVGWQCNVIVITAIALLFCVQKTQAAEPSVEQTQAYLIKNIPLFSESIGTPFPSVAVFAHEPDAPFTVIFSGQCRFVMRTARRYQDLRYSIDLSRVESARTSNESSLGHQSYKVSLFDGSAESAIVHTFKGIGPLQENRVPRVDFYTSDAETASRLANAFNHLRELCDAPQEPLDPFATPQTR
jgi:hypothetical protein